MEACIICRGQFFNTVNPRFKGVFNAVGEVAKNCLKQRSSRVGM